MPIRPENRQAAWAASEADFLFGDEAVYVQGLRAMGFDPLAQPQFWEVVVARMLGGNTTAHKTTHDVEVDLGNRIAFAEVKYSAGFVCAFTGKGEGLTGAREVFRWAKPRGCGGKYGVDAIILIGRAMSEAVFSWVIPLDAIGPNCASVTIGNPETRTAREGPWDRFAVPFGQLLPAFLRIAQGVVPPPYISTPNLYRRRIADKAGQLKFEIECRR